MASALVGISYAKVVGITLDSDLRRCHAAVPRGPDDIRELAMVQIMTGGTRRLSPTSSACEQSIPTSRSRIVPRQGPDVRRQVAEALRLWETWKAEPGRQFRMAHAYVMAGRRAEVERIAAANDHPYAWRSSMPLRETTTARHNAERPQEGQPG